MTQEYTIGKIESLAEGNPGDVVNAESFNLEKPTFPKAVFKNIVTQAINSLREQNKKERAFEKAIEMAVDGNFIVRMNEDICVGIIKIVEELISLIRPGETTTWFDYYVYECDMGDKFGKVRHKDGSEYQFQTITQFVDYIYDDLKPVS